MRKARIIIRARRLSRVARRRSSSEMDAAAGAAAGLLSAGFGSGAFFVGAGLDLAREGAFRDAPSCRRGRRRHLAVGQHCGQFGRFQEAPSALLTASAPASSRPAEEAPPFRIEAAMVRLVPGLELFEVAGVSARQEARSEEGFVVPL